MFSYGKKFKELWNEIPTVVRYWDYVGIANAIDDARTSYEITEQDEKVLLQTLELFCNERKVPLQDPRLNFFT